MASFPTWNTWGVLFARCKISPSCWTDSCHSSSHTGKRKNGHSLHWLQIYLWSLPYGWHNLEMPWIFNFCWCFYCQWAYNCWSVTGYFPPTKIAIAYCSAHTKEFGIISLGNNRADKAAKYTAKNGPLFFFFNLVSKPTFISSWYYSLSGRCSMIWKDKWIQKRSKQWSDGLYWAKRFSYGPHSFSLLACTFLPSNGMYVQKEDS